MTQALVVFHDECDHILASFLKKGFRHVFCCVLDDRDYWIVVDGHLGIPSIDVIAMKDFDLAGFYRVEGYTVIETETEGRPTCWPFMKANCVGFVKAILSIRSGAATPWQLYKYLRK